MKNPYLEQINNVIPRILALFEMDPYSPKYGVGDRLNWAWKLTDYANGTFQGAANGLARLQASNLLPPWLSNKAVNNYISAIFIGTDHIRRRNGSLEEAFPFESSFCVTALGAYDLLTCLEFQKELISADEMKFRLKVIEPMIDFLYIADEHHGIISNHLATASAALYKWQHITGDNRAESRAKKFLDRIKAHMSTEGWFKEYEGADPGYQTLCLSYLADIDRLRPDLGLSEILIKAIRFLCHFAHPDGSFGGIYGSRATLFYYPAGVEYLAAKSSEAFALSEFMHRSIANFNTVTLLSMDDENLIPMFNSYVWAAELFNNSKTNSVNELYPLPSIDVTVTSVDFPEAGIFIRGNKENYTVISIARGGVIASYTRDGKYSNLDSGCFFTYKGKKYSSQVPNATFVDNVIYGEGTITLRVSPAELNTTQMTPYYLIILRILNISIMRNMWLSNQIKRAMARLLITRRKHFKKKIIRTIYFDGDLARTECNWENSKKANGTSDLVCGGIFKCFHMASSGYWQKGDAEQ